MIMVKRYNDFVNEKKETKFEKGDLVHDTENNDIGLVLMDENQLGNHGEVRLDSNGIRPVDKLELFKKEHLKKDIKLAPSVKYLLYKKNILTKKDLGDIDEETIFYVAKMLSDYKISL